MVNSQSWFSGSFRQGISKALSWPSFRDTQWHKLMAHLRLCSLIDSRPICSNTYLTWHPKVSSWSSFPSLLLCHALIQLMVLGSPCCFCPTPGNFPSPCKCICGCACMFMYVFECVWVPMCVQVHMCMWVSVCRGLKVTLDVPSNWPPLCSSKVSSWTWFSPSLAYSGELACQETT